MINEQSIVNEIVNEINFIIDKYPTKVKSIRKFSGDRFYGRKNNEQYSYLISGPSVPHIEVDFNKMSIRVLKEGHCLPYHAALIDNFDYSKDFIVMNLNAKDSLEKVFKLITERLEDSTYSCL